MKKYIFSAAVVLAMGLTSCSLETESLTDLNTETAYKTQEAINMALVGCYDGWQRTISDEGIGMYLTAEFASDQAHGGLGLSDAKNNNVIDQFNLGIAPSYNDLFNTDWKNYYQAIFRCNMVLQAENTCQWSSETAKKTVIGQAHALRGILYFDLARLFGDVPLIKVPTTDNVPRDPVDSVYSCIFADFKYAMNNIPADAFPLESRASNDGHITKYAAEALLARAFLYYTGYYGKDSAPGCTKQDATNALQDIVNNGGYALETNYADLFMPACTTDASSGDSYAWNTTFKGKYYNNGGWMSNISKEVILNLKFSATQDYNGNADGNTFSVYLGPRNNCAKNVCIASGWGACSVTKAFVDTYKDDARFNACCWSVADAGYTSAQKEATINDSYEYTGYYTRKYAPMCFADGTRQEVGFKLGEQHMNITYYQDWTVMRYADVLLMLAELNKDVSLLNEVYHRSNPSKSYSAYSDENLRKERAIEFAFEGVHFWDLMRYQPEGAYAAQAIYDAQNGAAVQNGGVSATTSFDKANFTKKKGLMQIPNTQITLSGGTLTQNAGW